MKSREFEKLSGNVRSVKNAIVTKNNPIATTEFTNPKFNLI